MWQYQQITDFILPNDRTPVPISYQVIIARFIISFNTSDLCIPKNMITFQICFIQVREYRGGISLNLDKELSIEDIRHKLGFSDPMYPVYTIEFSCPESLFSSS